MKPIRSDLRKIALSSSKLVLSGAHEAGLSEQEVGAIKDRMKQWLHLLEVYAAKITEIRATKETAGDKRRSIEALLVKRDQERFELYEERYELAILGGDPSL